MLKKLYIYLGIWVTAITGFSLIFETETWALGKDINPYTILTAPNLPTGRYFVISVFSSPTYARRLSKRYKKFNPSIYQLKTQGKTIYRVIVGPLKPSKE